MATHHVMVAVARGGFRWQFWRVVLVNYQLILPRGRQWEMAGEAAWGVALHREAVIHPLAEQPRLSAESIAEAANQLGLSRSILYKLLQRYQRRPQTSSLLPWKRGPKPDEPLLSD